MNKCSTQLRAKEYVLRIVDVDIYRGIVLFLCWMVLKQLLVLVSETVTQGWVSWINELRTRDEQDSYPSCGMAHVLLSRARATIGGIEKQHLVSRLAPNGQ